MTQQPFLALITPIGEGSGQPPGGGAPGVPTHPIYYPGVPTHPIAPGGPPPQIWGPIGNYPDAGFPAPQPPITGNRPTHPIYYPPQIWGPIGNYPDAGFPAPQPPAGAHPSHPIYYPPIIWPGPGPLPGVEHPIAPGGPEGGGGDRQPKIEWKTAWSPSTGWIVVGVPTGEHVTPSKQESETPPA